MKIIAKTKDYYDYLQGVYGVDDKIVYDRRGGEVAHGGNLDILRVLINNVAYPMIRIGDRFKGTEEDFVKGSELIDIAISQKDRYSWYDNPLKGTFRKLKNPRDWFQRERKAKVSLNTEYREPVLIQWLSGWDWGGKNSISKPLHLSDYDFGAVMSAHEVYIEISNFLSWCVDNPPIPDKQTDKEKVVSHGFDLKTSFRHRK